MHLCLGGTDVTEETVAVIEPLHPLLVRDTPCRNGYLDGRRALGPFTQGDNTLRVDELLVVTPANRRGTSHGRGDFHDKLVTNLRFTSDHVTRENRQVGVTGLDHLATVDVEENRRATNRILGESVTIGAVATNGSNHRILSHNNRGIHFVISCGISKRQYGVTLCRRAQCLL